MRRRTPQRPGEEHPWPSEIARVARCAVDFARAVLTLGRFACNDAARGRVDRLDDAVVASAAADIARHPGFDIVRRRTWLLVQQRRRRHDLTRCADPALKSGVIDKGPLQVRSIHAFDGRDLGTVDRGWQHQA